MKIYCLHREFEIDGNLLFITVGLYTSQDKMLKAYEEEEERLSTPQMQKAAKLLGITGMRACWDERETKD